MSSGKCQAPKDLGPEDLSKKYRGREYRGSKYWSGKYRSGKYWSGKYTDGEYQDNYPEKEQSRIKHVRTRRTRLLCSYIFLCRSGNTGNFSQPGLFWADGLRQIGRFAQFSLKRTAGLVRFKLTTCPARWSISALLTLMSVVTITTGCGPVEPNDAELTKNVKLELVDWHISGLMVINSPVAWVRVSNYNPVSIKDITFEYDTFDAEGLPLDKGIFTIQDSVYHTVYPGEVRDFIELYLGLVNVRTEALRVKLLSVKRA